MASKLFLAAALLQGALSSPLAVEERQACAAQWGQCGGQDYTGPTCCQSGSTCVVSNQWYSQCLPGSSNPTTTSRTSTSSSSSTSRTSSSTSRPPSSVPTTPTSVPPTITTTPTTTPTGGSGPGTTASFTGNPFAGVNLFPNKFYSSEVHTLAIPSLTGSLVAKASAVAQVPSFQWLDIAAKVETLMPGALADVRAANAAGGNYAAQLVVYDLPDRDCAAAASNGEFSIADGGVVKYKAYIDAIRKQLLAYSDVRTILVIEPDSLANMVTNMGVPKCAGAKDAYLECTIYAVKQLNLPHVAMYLDGGHAGWLGWPANLQPAADLFGKLYADAGKPSQLRGMATNVANYNAWDLTTAPSYTTPNPNFDEKKYISAFAPLLAAKGWSAHFIIDQGRSGKQPTGQKEWGHWCNQQGVGFGRRPSANTGSELADAFVWIKPGGECDGVSDPTAPRFDHFCGTDYGAMSDAPQAGQWFQKYFEMLLTNANPPL
ncbi:1,4-beta-D-glucan cellobiohydrolase cel6a [Pyricularia oryzae]|uniref:1,4-beta-D-glucan cellobiohydrolase CEL6A n=5 Tax=Pyricularia TaxID=48558 RepID=CEL6A_PYRO7|nr:exoglucanase 2 [Pyricularia oryzae 70-15]G4MM92.1 RecName: Full=1,4-beta-D-glucan cellobiohydrolase CEL6A; AltName: Full=Beta-glucancellobiohydrolase CEL6A; AltName: Full=Exocellobiohydrolase CEL6A; AltName: Full=Exoglucanase CEL6A; Flags: Precursor [Pyricularia oryzae 70-15]ELQ36594.1 exoglucanase 2 [Pyricularia oryzae Y34]KAH9434683.1 1,4-beta-D-glucan cellobiohydrolase cel6a [Pyricularia oryzae]KAI6297248.1 1,4-beta-D-glucan cellobiohydrolase cel6a [Pyricularia grisea]EHA57773.1 exogluca